MDCLTEIRVSMRQRDIRHPLTSRLLRIRPDPTFKVRSHRSGTGPCRSPSGREKTVIHRVLNVISRRPRPDVRAGSGPKKYRSRQFYPGSPDRFGPFRSSADPDLKRGSFPVTAFPPRPAPANPTSRLT